MAAKRSMKELVEELSACGIQGRTVGIHSNLISIGLIADTPVSASEEKRGLNPIAKTVINAFLEAIGPQGTIFVPTHSCNFIGNYAPSNLKVDLERDAEGKVIKRTLVDDGYYNREKTPSLVGSFTQSIIYDDRAIRSEHPSHSIAAIGKEAEYLVRGHGPFSQPVGIHNAFTKVIGLDGIIFFIGETLKSNTSFHSYETLIFPADCRLFCRGCGSRVEWFETAFQPELGAASSP